MMLTMDEISEIRETARGLYEGLNTHVVIVSPHNRETGEVSHWVFEQSFDIAIQAEPLLDAWRNIDREQRWARLTNRREMNLLWAWLHSQGLSAAQVVFSYPR